MPVFALNPQETPIPIHDEQVEYKQAYWIFSGMVNTDHNEVYSYYFKMQRQGKQFHIQASLMNGQTNSLIFSIDEVKALENVKNLKWKVGHAFLLYNPVNANWSFGVHDDQGQGFNFKLNMVEKPDEEQKKKTLLGGLNIFIRQTSRVSGYILTGTEAKEQFVTANHSWYAKIWQNQEEEVPHHFKSLFCRLNDDSGFYAVKLKASDAKQAALAGLRNADGSSAEISQFVSIKKSKNKAWVIRISLPKLELQFNNLLPQTEKDKTDIAGFFKGDKNGFCFLSRQTFD